MRSLMLRDPVSGLFGLDSLIDAFTHGHSSIGANLKEVDSGYELQLAVPGYNKSEINIQIDNSLLKVTGKKEVKSEKYLWQEFGTTSFSRTFSLPKEVDIEHSEAKCQDGILTMTLPFVKKEKRSSAIKIT